MQALAGQEEQLRSDAARQQELADIVASLEAFPERVRSGLAQAGFEQRRQLVLLLVDRVVVTDADIEIRYVLPTSPDSEHVRFCRLRKDYFDHPAVAPHALAAVEVTPGDAGPYAAGAARLTAAPVVVVFVRMELVRAPARSTSSAANGQDGVQRRRQHLAVVLVGGSGQHAKRRAPGVDDQVALDARPATVRWVGPCSKPLLAATDALSSAARRQSICPAACIRSSSTRCRAAHTPAWCQSRSRRQQLMPEPHPISTGSISHGRPDRSTNKMPVSTARSGRRGRPPSGFGGSGGSSGAIAAHRSSGTSGLAITHETHQTGFH